MSITHTQTLVANLGEGGEALTGYATETGGTELLIDQSFSAETTDQLVAIAFGYAAVKAVYLLSDKDLTIETNSSSAADDTLALKAGKPLVWHATGAYFANPFTADVTKIYVTCALATHLQGVILTA